MTKLLGNDNETHVNIQALLPKLINENTKILTTLLNMEKKNYINCLITVSHTCLNINKMYILSNYKEFKLY